MSKSVKTRIIAGLCMIAAAVVLGVALDGTMTGPQASRWEQAIYIVSVIGTGTAGLLGLLAGKPGFIMGYALVLLAAMPSPWNRYVVVAELGALFLWMGVRSRSEKPAAEEAPGEEEPELTEEEQRLLEELSSLKIAENPMNSRMYQLIPAGDELLVYRVGGAFKGLREDLLQKDTETLRALGKDDFSIKLSDIRSVRLTELGNPLVSGMAVIKAAGRTYRFNAPGFADFEAYAAFWKSMIPNGARFAVKSRALNSQPADAPEAELPEAEPPNERRMAVLRVVKTCLGVYLAVVDLAWLFLHVPYGLFALLSLLATPVMLALYLCFPAELSMGEGKDFKDKISLSFLFTMSATAPALRALMDYNIIRPGRVFAIGGVVFAAAFGLFVLCSKEWKQQKVILLMTAMVLVFYAPSAVTHLNNILDASEPRSVACEVLDMRVSDDDDYYVTVLLPEGEEFEMRTGRERYDALEVGGEAVVDIYDGCFGIPYAVITEG